MLYTSFRISLTKLTTTPSSRFEEAKKILVQCLRALAYLHSHQLRPGRVWVGRVFWVGDRPWKSPRAPVVPQGMDPSMAPTPVPPKRNESTTGAPKQAMKVWEPQNMSCFGVNVRKTLGPGVCRATIAYGFIGSLLRLLLGGGLVGNVEETPSAKRSHIPSSPSSPAQAVDLAG